MLNRKLEPCNTCGHTEFLVTARLEGTWSAVMEAGDKPTLQLGNIDSLQWKGVPRYMECLNCQTRCPTPKDRSWLDGHHLL